MTRSKWILLAEDNANDADLTARALEDAALPGKVVLARDGSEALDCLYHRGAFPDSGDGPPFFILLDLKMPKVDGLEVLRQIKADPQLKRIPVVVFTSSREERDLASSYNLGANAYVVKPVSFRDFNSAVKQLRAFWLGVNEAPPERTSGGPPEEAKIAA